MANNVYYDFEKPIYILEEKIEELKKLSIEEKVDFSVEITALEERLKTLINDIFSNLSSWQKVQLARHPRRPYTLDYINNIFSTFIELHGDRRNGDDNAIVTGLANFQDEIFFVVGHQKGRDTKENLERNFGMASPEGYRKAKRIFKLAEKFNKPVITFIDTSGAYPGIEAEEKGQGEAIASNLLILSVLKTPIIVCIIGEGGSGGALAIGIGDRILMLENSVYSVISPEGCAAILWKDSSKAAEAAERLKPTASELLKLKVIDKIVKEPAGGAHRNPQETINELKKEILNSYNEIKGIPIADLLNQRYQKLRNLGAFQELNKNE